MPRTITRTERSYCRICGALCGILVDLNDDQVVRVRGDRDHPHSRGYTCPKGRGLPQMHHHPKRLEHPLMRIDGALQPVSWDECLDDLGSRLRDTVDRHGPSSVGIFYGSGNGNDAAGFRMTQALQAAIGTPARFTPMTIDGAAKTLAETLMIGVPNLHPRTDYENATLILFIGANPVVSHGHIVGMPNPVLAIRAVARRGEVWVIDPLHTETARFATDHIAPLPGSDYAILAFLIRETLAQGANLQAVNRQTVDVEALRDAVAPFEVDHAAEIAGVNREGLLSLLAAVRRAGRLAIETGTGATMASTANLTQWFAYALMVITDSMNRPGGVWFHPGFIRQIDGKALMVIDQPFGPGPKSRPELHSFVGDWPCAALPDEINAGNIRAFLNPGGALMRSFPGSGALKPALRHLDLLANFDVIENDTTALSTHVLPCKDMLERPDVMIWDTISPQLNMHYTPAVAGPTGEQRSTWWIMAELIRRLGHEPLGDPPADDRSPGADDAMLGSIMVEARHPFEDIVAQRYVCFEHAIPAQWIDQHVERFGGWRLAPPLLVEQLAAERSRVSSTADQPKKLLLIPRRQRRHMNAYLLFLGSSPEVLLNPSDAAAAGITEGQRVSVRSKNGEIVGIASIDKNMRQGVVSVPHGFDGEANVNLLTSAEAVDPLTGMAHFSALPVTISPQ